MKVFNKKIIRFACAMSVPALMGHALGFVNGSVLLGLSFFAIVGIVGCISILQVPGGFQWWNEEDSASFKSPDYFTDPAYRSLSCNIYHDD